MQPLTTTPAGTGNIFEHKLFDCPVIHFKTDTIKEHTHTHSISLKWIILQEKSQKPPYGNVGLNMEN